MIEQSISHEQATDIYDRTYRPNFASTPFRNLQDLLMLIGGVVGGSIGYFFVRALRKREARYRSLRETRVLSQACEAVNAEFAAADDGKTM